MWMAGEKRAGVGLALKQLEPEAKLETLAERDFRGGDWAWAGAGGIYAGVCKGSFVDSCPLPMVIDADALNAFAGKAHLLGGFVRQAKIMRVRNG